MNCLTDLECEYISKHGLIEKIIILSINNDDCVINILRYNSIIRTQSANIRFLIAPHQPVNDITSLKIKDDLLLTEETFCTPVTVVKVNGDETVEVLIKSNILVDGEQMIQTNLNKLNICGQYFNLEELRLLNIPINISYSRYLNNNSIFKPLLSRVENVLICWDAEEGVVHVRAIEEQCLKRVELLMPVFVHQLGLLLGRDVQGRMDKVARYIVWEYQYEDEEEANFAIGQKGAHILTVRAMPGIAAAVLTKTNRLRIIAENKHVLRDARSLLEIRRESYMFEDSLVPMLVGKSATHINDLIHKTGLHCIHLRNNPSNGVICERPTIVDTSMMGKRELFLFGTNESITSAKLLLEIEESVKDLRRELEIQKLTRNSSSTSSVSKDCEKGMESRKGVEVDGNHEKIGINDVGMKEETGNAVLSWADTPLDDESDEDQGAEKVGNHENKEGGGLRRLDGVHGLAGGRQEQQGNNDKGCRKSGRKPPLSKYHHQGGVLVFTNTALSSSNNESPTQGRNHRSSGARQTWAAHPNNNSTQNQNLYHQEYLHYQQHHQQKQQQQYQQHQHPSRNRYPAATDDDNIDPSHYNQTCAQ